MGCSAAAGSFEADRSAAADEERSRGFGTTCNRLVPEASAALGTLPCLCGLLFRVQCDGRRTELRWRHDAGPILS